MFDELYENLLIVVSHRYGIDRGKVLKSRVWICMVFPNLDETRFRQIVRVNRAQFDVILSLIQNNPVFNCAPNRQYPVFVQLALILYRLGCYGESASIGKIATLFGIGDGGKIDKITKRVLTALLKLESRFLYWPNKTEKDVIISETIHKLPQCIGYLDGTEIKLAERPCVDPDSFYSRKQHFSIKAQAVCDYKLKIRHLYVGYPGSVHDSRMFTNSSLSKQPSNFFSGAEWLAADSAYKLNTTIICPYRKNSNIGNARERAAFNTYFSKYRVRIEHCFALLKERFCSLKELRFRLKNAESNKYACAWITACCILHNIILDNYDDLDRANMENIHLDHDDGDDNNDINTDSSEGEMKRKAIYELIKNQ